jgi:hypothetical protein
LNGESRKLMRPSRRPSPLLNAAILCLILGCSAGSLTPQAANELPSSWNDAVRALADKIIAALPAAHSATLDLNNISSLHATDAAEIRRSLEAELVRRGIHIGASTTAEVQVKLTLSEGVDGYVWAAEIHQADQFEIALVSVPRQSSSASEAAPAMSLERQRIWAQAQPILDFASSGTPSTDLSSVLLTPTGLYGFRTAASATGGIGGGTFPRLTATRDPRGEIVSIEGTTARAYVDGLSCTGSWGSSVRVECGEKASTFGGEYPYAASRNYFTAFESSSGRANQTKFFSVAIDSAATAANRYILTEVDGKARLYDNSGSAAATFEGWGDEIATIRAGCDGGWRVLVTGTSDFTRADQIQIYEIRDRQAIAVGQPMSFPGPILALWPTPDGKSARVVSRNLQTGMYEASTVTVSCGN